MNWIMKCQQHVDAIATSSYFSQNPSDNFEPLAISVGEVTLSVSAYLQPKHSLEICHIAFARRQQHPSAATQKLKY
jgi:hypothetical protein